MPNITVSVVDDRMNEYVQQADVMIAQARYDHALAKLYRGLSLAEILGDKYDLAQIRLRIAEVLHNQGLSDQALEWCEGVLTEPADPKIACRFSELYALNLLRQGKFIQAQKVLQSLADHPDEQVRRTIYINLGLLDIFLFRYFKQLTLERAERYLGEALKMSMGEDGKPEPEMAGRLYYYLALELMEEGLYHYSKEKLLLAQQYTTNKIEQIQIFNELGKACIKLMEFDIAESYLNKARYLSMQLSYQYGLHYNVYYRGLLYMEQLELENACSHFLTAVYDFLRKKHYPEVSAIYLLLSQLYQSQNSEKSDKYMDLYNNYLHMCELTEAVETAEKFRWKTS